MPKLDKLTIRGFKSIARLDDFPLGDLNVLIGANGSGKSNFVDLFRLLKAMSERRFQAFVTKNGPADGYFHHGVSFTKRIEVELDFDRNPYSFAMEPTAEGTIMIADERLWINADQSWNTISRGAPESLYLPVFEGSRTSTAARHLNYSPFWWQVYHFHDTSQTAGARRDVGFDQGNVLQADASNLAAFLLNLSAEDKDHYRLICNTIRRIAPYFEGFHFKTTENSKEPLVRLTWRQKGSDYVFSPGHFSDGTLRFICLATALLQPRPPATIVIDEPELGLHPEALTILAGLMRSAATRTQIIVATQSPVLVSEFGPQDVITVNQKDGASQFQRLSGEELESWLNDYSVGDLWQKGVIRGGINNG